MRIYTKKIERFKKGFLAIILAALIIVSTMVGYYTYSSFLEFDRNQNKIQTDVNNLSSQLEGFQTELRETQDNNNNTILEFNSLKAQFAELESQYKILQTEYNNLSLRHTTFQAQYNNLQSQFSLLQNSFTKFVTDFQTNRTIEPYNYLIFSDGQGNYYAENGATGRIDFSGSSGTQVGQSCINALSIAGGKILFQGSINLNGPLIIQNGASNGRLEISGYGSSSQLLVSQNSEGIRIIGSQPFGYGGPYHVTIKDLVLTSSTTRIGRFINTGIYIKNWFGVDIKDVMVFYANNAGILIEDSADIQVDNVYVEGCSGIEYGGTQPLIGTGFWLKGSKDSYLRNCYSDTNYNGFRIDSTSETNSMPRSIFLTHCEATLSQNFGILISRADGVIISDSLVEGSNQEGIWITDSYRVNVANTLVIGNVGNGILISSNSLDMIQSQILIKDCTIKSNSQNGIKIWANYDMPITQVSIQNCNIILSGTGARGNPDQPNTWDGVFISNDALSGGRCAYIKITDCYIGNIAGAIKTQSYGIRSLQNTDFVQIYRNNFFNNLAENYTLVGANNTIEGNINET